MRSSFVLAFVSIILSSSSLTLGGCGGSEPATAYVQNAFMNAPFTLVRVSYRGVTFDQPITKGTQSSSQQVPAGAAPAYALAATAWDPASGTPAPTPIVLALKAPVEAIAGTTVPVVFSEPSHTGKCAGMPKADYDAIATTWFPGQVVQDYDTIQCPR